MNQKGDNQKIVKEFLLLKKECQSSTLFVTTSSQCFNKIFLICNKGQNNFQPEPGAQGLLIHRIWVMRRLVKADLKFWRVILVLYIYTTR